MKSLILVTTSRVLGPLLLLFSVFLLFRGHNEPGGGFAGGLVAATVFILSAFADGVTEARRSLRISPRWLITAGLAIALISGLISLLHGLPPLTGIWWDQPVLIIGKLGTPFLFDIGVYLLVLGIALSVVFALMEAS